MLPLHSSVWEADGAGAPLEKVQEPAGVPSPLQETPGYLPSCCLMEFCQWRFSRSG